jgi:urease accessory protein
MTPFSAAPNEIRSAPGTAELLVERVHDQSAVTFSRASAPLKILNPRARGPAVWSFLSNFGGGLVAGDRTRLSLRVKDGAVCFLGSQASTKIYRNPNALPCAHSTEASVESGALLVMVPQPVQAFADSIYVQKQKVQMAPGSSVVWVDCFTSGRAACGERWAFKKLEMRTEILNGSGRRCFLDGLRLEGGEVAGRMGRFNAFATVTMMGETLGAAISSVLDEVAQSPVERRPALIESASDLPNGGVVLRIAGEEPQVVAERVRARISFLSPLLHGEPWLRKC